MPPTPNYIIRFRTVRPPTGRAAGAIIARFRLLRDALDAASDAAAITDDASAVEAMGHAPVLVEGHPRNLKVTLPRDIEIAELYLAAP